MQADDTHPTGMLYYYYCLSCKIQYLLLQSACGNNSCAKAIFIGVCQSVDMEREGYPGGSVPPPPRTTKSVCTHLMFLHLSAILSSGGGGGRCGGVHCSEGVCMVGHLWWWGGVKNAGYQAGSTHPPGMLFLLLYLISFRVISGGACFHLLTVPKIHWWNSFMWITLFRLMSKQERHYLVIKTTLP